MPRALTTDLIRDVAPAVDDILTSWAAGLPDLRCVDVRREVTEGKFAVAEDGTARSSGGGHWTPTAARLGLLVRTSSTVFETGTRDPLDVIAKVDRGCYLVGHRAPSIAESRENVRLSARKVYGIRDGRPGRLYRDGGIDAESRDFLMAVDAMGTDLRPYPISNRGEEPPMETRKLCNGGPTMRSRIFLAGGS